MIFIEIMQSIMGVTSIPGCVWGTVLVVCTLRFS